MAARKVSCPTCSYRFTPPAVPRKRKVDNRTDEQIRTLYDKVRAFNLQKYGTPFIPSTYYASEYAFQCRTCQTWQSVDRGTFVGGECYPCYQIQNARCTYCNGRGATLDDQGMCATCLNLIASRSEAWREVERINASRSAA